ncbi:hypothetical protein ACC778_36635, partial [Rhizobium ruizarguesonis]
HRLNIETCVTPPCKSGTKSRVSPQPDSRPGQLSLHQSADNFTVPCHDLSPMYSDCLQSEYLIRTPIVGNTGPTNTPRFLSLAKKLRRSPVFFSTSANVRRLVATIGEYELC